MGFKDKVKAAFVQKPLTLQIAETNQNLDMLEKKFRALVKMERNAVRTAQSRKVKLAAEERLRNAYVSLKLVHMAQERLYDASSTYELSSAVKDLSKTLGVLNRLDRKSDVVSPALFLNFRSKKLLNREKSYEEGGMKQYYDQSIEEILVGETAWNNLLNNNVSLDNILKMDGETQGNLDDYQEFVESPDNEIPKNVMDDINSKVDDIDWDNFIDKLV